MMLEFGYMPVRYVLKKKHLQFLYFILNESTDSIIRQVYDALNEDSRKGDFISLINCDKIDLKIDLTDDEISLISKYSWKKYVKEKVNIAAFNYLVTENELKEKTKQISYTSLKMRNYLLENENCSLSKIIFSIRSQTLDIKEWKPWNYKDNLCVKCSIFAETMDHFVTCESYEKITEKIGEIYLRIMLKDKNKLEDL